MSDDRKQAGAPIAWHPLFPAILAVWFGALFGLGVLAVRVALLERIVVASGIDLLIPAAAPPLGMTARLLIALGFALFGSALGLILGSQLARSKPSAVARRAEVAAAKAARAEEARLIETAAAVPAQPAAVTEAANFIDISQLDLDREVADNVGIALDAPVEQPVVEQPAIEQPAIEILVEAPVEAPAEIAEAPAEPKAKRRPDPAYFPLPAAFPVPGGAAAQRLMAADLDSLSHLELIERLALSLQKRREETPVYLDAASAEVLATEPAPEPVDEAEIEAAAPLPPVPSYYPPAPEPVALFRESAPAAARQDSVATERALRDALNALQRMSGAA